MVKSKMARQCQPLPAQLLPRNLGTSLRSQNESTSLKPCSTRCAHLRLNPRARHQKAPHVTTRSCTEPTIWPKQKHGTRMWSSWCVSAGHERQQSACTKSTHDSQSPLVHIFKRQLVGGWGQSWHQSSMLRLTIFWRRRCWVLSAAGICERRLFGKTAKQESWFRCTGVCRVRRIQQGRRRRRRRRRRRGRSAECG